MTIITSLFQSLWICQWFFWTSVFKLFYRKLTFPGSQSVAGGGGAHSIISNRKTSTISGHKPEAGPGDKKDKKEKKQDDNATQLSSSPPPGAPIARRLSVSASVAGEEGLMSCILPEDLLVEILAERLHEESVLCVPFLLLSCTPALPQVHPSLDGLAWALVWLERKDLWVVFCRRSCWWRF